MPLSPPDVLVRPEITTRPVVGVGARPAVAIGMAALLGLAWGGPIVVRMIGDGDFPFHLETARVFAATGAVTMPHFLLQVLLGIVLATGLFASPASAGIVFFCALYAGTAGLICWYVARGSGSVSGLLGSVILAVAVLMSAPILPREEPSLYLIGYFPINAYHNPTMLLAKPLLVLTLMCAVAAVTRTGRLARREIVLLVTPVVLLGLAKPNYLGCLVPVLLSCGVGASVSRQPVSWRRVMVVCGAAVGTLAVSYFLYRSDELGFQSGVVFAPLEVIKLYAPVDTLSVMVSLAASLAFPLAVTVLWPRAAMNDPTMLVAWGGAAVGLFLSYFLAEAGTRLPDGNFLWTGQMAVFVLFVAAAAFVRARLQVMSASSIMFGRALTVGIVLLLHVESGVRHAAVKLDSSRWLAFWM
jgi:hypothetical protein